MRILYHHRTQANDGQAVHIRSMIAAFGELGHEVEEVGLVRHTDESGASAPPADSGGSAKWGWVTRLPRFLRELAEYGYNGPARSKVTGAALRFEPDFLYERYAFGNLAGGMAARKLGLPLVLEVNSPMVLELERTRGLSFPGLARKVETNIFKSADRVCVVTRVLADMLLEMGVEPERIFVTPNGVHLEHFRVGDPQAARRAALSDLGLPDRPDELVLGFVGYYRPWHKLELVLAALAAPELAKARLVLVGEGPAHEELVRAAADLGVAERVHFAGTRPHGRIPALLAAFDIGLVPAINPYASPLKLHEYMAAGVPTIAPDQPNLREVLTQGEDALLFDTEREGAIEEALFALAADPERRRAMGEAARRTIEERDLTWTGNARRVLTEVKELL